MDVVYARGHKVVHHFSYNSIRWPSSAKYPLWMTLCIVICFGFLTLARDTHMDDYLLCGCLKLMIKIREPFSCLSLWAVMKADLFLVARGYSVLLCKWDQARSDFSCLAPFLYTHFQLSHDAPGLAKNSCQVLSNGEAVGRCWMIGSTS